MRLLGLEIRRPAPPAVERRDSADSFTLAELSEVGSWQGILERWNSAAGPVVNEQTALGVPAFWAGVRFLSTMVAALPFHEFKRGPDGARERVTSGMIAGMLAGTVNDDYLTRFKWVQGRMTSALLTGAGRTWVEKDAGGRPVNLWPLETARTRKVVQGGRTLYHYRQAGQKSVTYEASEVLDITLLDQLDGVKVFNPVVRLQNTLGLALALQQHANRFFSNGGVPPLAMHTPIPSPGAAARQKSDTNEAIRAANRDHSNILILPIGAELKAVGIDPEKGQLVEGQRFVVEELARILGLPPVFLQDLAHGNFANTEQQDLHLTKHVAAGWVAQWEGECNAKFYGPRSTSRFVEMNLDGLMRGAFRDRTEGVARAIQTGQLTPNEARAMDNRPPMPGGDRLLIQGATVPLADAGKMTPAPGAGAAPPADPADTVDPDADPAEDAQP